MPSLRTDNGAALVETAIVLPVLILLIVGGLILGLATVDDIRLERASADAALFPKPEARELVESVGGEVLCYWRGSGKGGCYNDGLDFHRTQIIGEGRTWVYPTGTITPRAHVSRPTETTTTTTTTETTETTEGP